MPEFADKLDGVVDAGPAFLHRGMELGQHSGEGGAVGDVVVEVTGLGRGGTSRRGSGRRGSC